MKTSKEIMNMFMDKYNGIYIELGNEEVLSITDVLGFSNGGITDKMIIVTNTQRYFGAMEIFNSNVINKLRDFFKEDFYILPSSVHEVITVSKSFVEDKSDLLKMVVTVNKTEVKERDRLGDFVLFYNYEKDTITIADTYIQM